MNKFLKSNKDLLWFSVILVKALWYFLTQFIGLEYHEVYSPIDDSIPFLAPFVIPYVIWYLYIPFLMFLLYKYNLKFFKLQAKGYLAGVIISGLFFIFYPTMISFRPVIDQKDIFSYIVTLIYSNDKPVNVFPSLHCFEAIFVHLTTFYGLKLALFSCQNPKLKDSSISKNNSKSNIYLFEKVEKLNSLMKLKSLSLCLSILICLSTMFIKQHSILDVISGVFMAILIYLSVKKINNSVV